MAWIESHTTLARHPKTLRLARSLGVSVPAAIGHLHLLWWWALEYAQDGDLSQYDAEEIALACQWDGPPDVLRMSLEKSGFVDADVHLHDWHDYAGKLLERRREDAERKKRARAADVQNPSLHISRPVRRTSTGHPTDGARTVPNPTVPNTTEPPTANTVGVAPDADAPDAPAPLVVRSTSAAKAGSDGEHRALWDAFTAVFGPARTQPERDRRGKACKTAREARASPEEIYLAAQHWPNVMGDATMTELGIVSNLGKLLHGPQVNGRSNGTVRSHRQSVTETALITRGQSVADVRRARQDFQRHAS